MISGQRTYPLMTWPEQAYVQIDQVGQFTAAAGCAIYDGGAWPEKWRGAYFTGEPTLNIVHQQFLRPDGVSYTTVKEPGREQTEFMRSRDLWFRPIETRVGPDGALYIIDFYNQAVIHNDTRGPVHGPANAAVRPDRDHYFGRIWRVQHKQATTLDVPVLDRSDLAGSHPCDGDESERARQADGVAPGARKLRLGSAPGPGQRSRWAARCSRCTNSRARATTDAERAAVLDQFAAATDNWTRSALIAAATEQAPAYVSQAFRLCASGGARRFRRRRHCRPRSGRASAERCCSSMPRRTGPPPRRSRRSSSRAIGRTGRQPGRCLTRRSTKALQTLLADPATTAAAACRWRRSGTRPARSAR